MQHVAASEDARHAGLEAFVDNRAVRHAGERSARAEGELIFRNQTDGQKQRIAGIILFRARNGLQFVIHGADGNACHAVFAVNLRYGMAELQRDAEVVETLDDIAL